MKMTQMRKAVMWVFQIFLAVVFLTMGMAKLSGVQSTVSMFERLAFGQWLRYLAGGMEVLGAVLLLFGPYSVVGAGLILTTMIGAVLAHLFLIGGDVFPAAAFALVSALLIYMKREDRRTLELEEQWKHSRRKSA
jgi:putative oxidoreductase